MATKKTTALAPAAAPVTALANWEDEMRKEAQDLASKVTVTSQVISFKGGEISIGGNPVSNPLPVLIADACFENALYTTDFDPDHPAIPECFAFGRDEATMKPHPDSAKPRHADCKTCPLNQFGSSGKGKACKNQVRLMVYSGTVTPDEISTAEVLPAKLPPTSISNWAAYVKGLRDMGLVPWATITHLGCEKFKTWFKVTFRPTGKITGEMWAALKARRASVEEMMMQPYKAREEAAPAPRAKGRGKF